ncbi:MAG TPA: FdhF/YdeP family oxidoreductase [Candidatus Polarisedimenticolaceae bacterium]|nr:FdhF/YdeP family oxidoreductase [Candidatus Polarisedimenticolaceae bacterium]
MPKPRVAAGGGFAAIAYTLKKGRQAGGVAKLYKRLRSRNACKTCAYGMGGQRGGMVNEAGHFPEVCKKSIQAQAGDMQAPVTETFFREHAIAELSTWSSMRLEAAGRLTFPIAWSEADTHFRRIGWNEALDRTAAALREAPRHETFFYGSGRSSNEAAFLMQVLARAYGTANIHNCSFYCHQASGVALMRVVGSGTATVVLEDLDRTDLALVAGANPASNHPRLVMKLVEMRKRGGKVIVVNPVKELGLTRFRVPSKPGSLLFGSDVSDLYLQPHVGSDVAVFKALLKGVIEAGAVDRAFLSSHAEGWEAVEADVAATPWEKLLPACGLTDAQIDRAVAAIASAKRGIFLWSMGLTHHENGVDNVTALANLALARGWVGREGCGLLPIRGHSNVQGVGSVGFSPAIKDAFAKKMQEIYGIPAAGVPGMDTYRCMVAAAEGKIRAAVFVGGNLFGSNPDRTWSGDALRRIGTTCYIATKLNEGHVHGRGRFHVVLPVFARDEESQSTTQESMFNYVRLSDGGEAPPAGELKSEVEVICALAARILPPGPFPFETMTSHELIRRAIADVVPGYGAIASIGLTKEEFQVAGRTFHEGVFPTPSGKAQPSVTPLPAFTVAGDEYRLMTLRSEGQFNTVVYEEEDLYRGTTRRDVVMMSEKDGARLGIAEGDAVEVATETGRLRVVAAFIDIPPGNLAMYYPEANAIVPRRVDPKSGTPAFKSVAARLAPVRS